MRRRSNNPFRFRSVAIHASTCSRHSDLALCVPDNLAFVSAISQDVTNGRDAAGLADSSLLRLRRPHSVRIELVCDALEGKNLTIRLTVQIFFESCRLSC